MRRMRRVPNSCPCIVCPAGCLSKNVKEYRGRFGWWTLHCQQCGSVWSAWHALCHRGEVSFTVRRVKSVNPGHLSVVEMAALEAKRADLKRSGALDGR